MKLRQLLLWATDVTKGSRKRLRDTSGARRRPPPVSRPSGTAPAIEVVAAPTPPEHRPTRPARSQSAPTSARERYELVTREMLKNYGVRVRKWRTSMSGVAWQVTYQDGHVARLIEAPRPRGPMSAAVFLHEIGHHAIGFGTYKPRCLEEYHAWRWSLEQMEANGLNVTPRVRERMAQSLRYAVAKARRRGLKRLPVELEPFVASN